MASGKSLLMDLAAARASRNGREESARVELADRAPTGWLPAAEGVPVGRETWPLSLRITIIFSLSGTHALSLCSLWKNTKACVARAAYQRKTGR